MFATAVELLRNHLQWDGPVRLNVIGMRTAVGVPVLKKINLNVARDPAIPESAEPAPATVEWAASLRLPRSMPATMIAHHSGSDRNL